MEMMKHNILYSSEKDARRNIMHQCHYYVFKSHLDNKNYNSTTPKDQVLELVGLCGKAPILLQNILNL